MRLHELTATAFGPFAETVRVDFDDLGAAGLFLLTGQTGAGKTSILDAVCFGLYGDVPGDRSTARALRSDHAAPDEEPRVVLHVSVKERSFRFSRSPAWDRPKRRGSGTRRIQASVVVEELLAGTWTAVTTRLDEAGQLVTELLGMTSTQFTQVVLLPQGRFQTFLRASSAERHQVLQRLFRTTRFDDVEQWLVESRQEARRAVAAAHDRCASVLDRLCEVGGVPTPPEWQPADAAGLGALVDDGSLTAWCDSLLESAAGECERHAVDREDADNLLAGLTQRLTAARATRSARLRGEEAQQRLADLEAQAQEVERAAQQLARHQAALPVAPLARRVGTASEELARAAAHVAERRAAAREAVPESGTATPATLERLRADLERRHGLAESWLPRERELLALRRRRSTTSTAVVALTERVEVVAGELDRAAETRGRLEQQREPLRPSAGRVADLTAAAVRLRAGLEAAQELEAVEADLLEATSEQQRLTRRALDLKDQYLDLRERRISGMAAELATALAVGCSCPVCGSVEHPAPAVSRSTTTKDAEEAARGEAESAEVVSQASREVLAGLRSRRDALSTRSGERSVASWERAVHETEAELETAARDRDRLDHLGRQLDELREQRAATETTLATTRAELVAGQETDADLEARVDLLAGELDALLSHHDQGHDTVADLVRDLEEERTLVAETLAAARAESEAATALAEAQGAAAHGVRAAGFDSIDDCLAAVLEGALADLLGARLEGWRTARAECAHVLRSTEVAAAMLAEQVDLPALEAEVARQHDVRDLHLAASRASAQRATRLGELHRDLRARLDEWQPRRDHHESVASLTSLVEGTGPDNRLRMRLSGYVLAERLRQVVAAANERLARMTEQRFALEHSEEKGAGEQRGGLSLRVRDDWSGTSRDPATLSGGESFVVSLALALGLADTVSHEAGGTEIETLFVDEGFGALDAETLDAVMDVLDGLRDGGRVVGIVSHVAELRARVTAQLEVHKGHSGSTVGTVSISA